MPSVDLSQIVSGLQYAAQTYLPGHPQTVNATIRSASDLANMLEQGVNSHVPAGPNAPFNNQGQSTTPSADATPSMIPDLSVGDIMRNNTARNAPDAAGDFWRMASAWFDVQRVAFLVIGIGLVLIGVRLIATTSNNASLDDALKNAQLKIANNTLTEQTALVAKRKAREERRAAQRPMLAYSADHASHPRPDFGPPLIEEPIRRGPSGKPGPSITTDYPPTRNKRSP